MSSRIIAWLVPSAPNSPADKASRLPANQPLATPASSPYLSSIPGLPGTARSQLALELRFDHPTKQKGTFVIGTSPECDIVLPPHARVSKRHCAISFDAGSRLVLRDFSEHGTQVWYDWECSGDQTGYSWVLSGPSDGFPATVNRIIIDIQGVRFHVVLNDHSADWEGYEAQLDAFCGEDVSAAHCWRGAGGCCGHPQSPVIQHVFVNEPGEPGDVYLWDTSRPWEPMVKASA
ncbi:uncharacterized protein UV8b_07668 [Ustilaginoidea virens]|uniref:FHA domain-containing protein n=1 Tax=Ustilaginoidea virens TaxID=1159556 RepID=A0A8E5HXR9_USTVR|nr:uncharacterized protein UV8b_07668 [Ustilaginoidea virens]QUC23427.1 hypothetical protein UV8b_07668 [Ustilaginoidea virens]